MKKESKLKLKDTHGIKKITENAFPNMLLASGSIIPAFYPLGSPALMFLESMLTITFSKEFCMVVYLIYSFKKLFCILNGR